jgi:hypothetical protein
MSGDAYENRDHQSALNERQPSFLGMPKLMADVSNFAHFNLSRIPINGLEQNSTVLFRLSEDTLRRTKYL